MSKGLRIVVVVGLVGQLCGPAHAHAQAGKHNETLSDLQRERRLALDDIEFRFANEVPDAVRARCASGARGSADGIDRECLREEVDREKTQELRGLRGAFTEKWEEVRSGFMRDCNRLMSRHPNDVPEELRWSCR